VTGANALKLSAAYLAFKSRYFHSGFFMVHFKIKTQINKKKSIHKMHNHKTERKEKINYINKYGKEALGEDCPSSKQINKMKDSDLDNLYQDINKRVQMTSIEEQVMNSVPTFSDFINEKRGRKKKKKSKSNSSSGPCWDGYKQYGTKKKDGEEVPNCVPESLQVNEINMWNIRDRDIMDFDTFMKFAKKGGGQDSLKSKGKHSDFMNKSFKSKNKDDSTDLSKPQKQ
jgi:hypothetical protein